MILEATSKEKIKKVHCYNKADWTSLCEKLSREHYIFDGHFQINEANSRSVATRKLELP